MSTSSNVQQPQAVAVMGLGQGKRTVTLLTEGGCYYPIISNCSYDDRQVRAKSTPQNAGRIRGTRPMHQTTLVIPIAPWTPETVYQTTSKQNFGGSKLLNPAQRPALCPSMHKSQIKLTHSQDSASDWNTHYSETFVEKPIVPANRLHLTSLVNRLDQQEGAKVKESIKADNSSPNYFTQYTRIHGKLGTMLGTGVPRDYPIRQEYNVITGETGGPAWRENNKRISGDTILYNCRKEQATILG